MRCSFFYFKKLQNILFIYTKVQMYWVKKKSNHFHDFFTLFNFSFLSFPSLSYAVFPLLFFFFHDLCFHFPSLSFIFLSCSFLRFDILPYSSILLLPPFFWSSLFFPSLSISSSLFLSQIFFFVSFHSLCFPLLQLHSFSLIFPIIRYFHTVSYSGPLI